MDYETALKVGSPFGGGIGLMGETCGAVTGAFMIIGLKQGATDTKNKASKARTYELVKKFVKRFKTRNDSIICRELIGFDIDSKKNLNPDAWMIVIERCPDYIKDASEILEEILEV
ncbi:MAG: C_GCAxxG_C_C family protein [Nitrospirae bacterium]|nr:C_GCAxxG_C_C family protein [Nitrospirota bacterium]